MNKEVKMTVAVLLCFVIGIVYLEFSNREIDITNVEPIPSVKIVEPSSKSSAPKTPAPVPSVEKQLPPNVLLKKVLKNENVKSNSNNKLSKEPDQLVEVQPSTSDTVSVIKTQKKMKDASSSPREEQDNSRIKPSDSIPRFYIVKKGDSVSEISRRVLGSIHFLKPLMEMNPELQPHRLFPGTRLAMPTKKTLISVATRYNEKNESEGKYFVQKGDTLYNIALRECGSVSKVKQIIMLNPEVDPSRLMVGQRLRLPTEK